MGFCTYVCRSTGLAMTPQIENLNLSKPIEFVTRRRVIDLISVIPSEHLVALDKIVLFDEFFRKEEKLIGGRYIQKSKKQPCSIELSIGSIYRGMPIIFYFFPFIAKFLLAQVLYHEIGHHYQRVYTHGIGKREEEYFAEKYAKEMLKKKFRWWLMGFMPLSPFVAYLRRMVK
jgi:hypothetical protein